jgi:hypothetical protein
MFVGGAKNPRTRYNCGVIEEARKARVKVLRGPSKFGDPRQLHRPDLMGKFSAAHERAGEGKYVDNAAVSADGRKVIGAQFVNPYLANDGSYRMIVATFHSLTGKKNLNGLESSVEYNREDSTHLVWKGKRNSDDAVVMSPLVTEEELYAAAVRLNKKLAAKLRRSKSPRKGVKHHLGSFEKFKQNLDVMRRARHIRNIATGEIDEDTGGATPYAMPLEQCGFAIDMLFLTVGVDENGNEIGKTFYRMAYGRGTPHVLTYSDWLGEDINSKVAFKDEKARAAVKKARAKAA